MKEEEEEEGKKKEALEHKGNKLYLREPGWMQLVRGGKEWR
jgi:hypothetical protein